MIDHAVWVAAPVRNCALGRDDAGLVLTHPKVIATMRSVIVLGAGMIGVATALHLQRRGWSVVLVDRKPPGRETSYGNTGIIQSEAVRPYPLPRDLSSLAAIAMRRTNDVHYSVASL